MRPSHPIFGHAILGTVLVVELLLQSAGSRARLNHHGNKGKRAAREREQSIARKCPRHMHTPFRLTPSPHPAILSTLFPYGARVGKMGDPASFAPKSTTAQQPSPFQGEGVPRRGTGEGKLAKIFLTNPSGSSRTMPFGTRKT